MSRDSGKSGLLSDCISPSTHSCKMIAKTAQECATICFDFPSVWTSLRQIADIWPAPRSTKGQPYCPHGVPENGNDLENKE